MKPPLTIKDRDVTELALSLVGPYDGVRIRFGDMVVKITGVRTMRFSSNKCYRRNLVIVNIPRQSRGLYDVSRSKRLGQTANAV